MYYVVYVYACIYVYVFMCVYVYICVYVCKDGSYILLDKVYYIM